jgi:long-chain acyl-CoA synthetase
MNSSPTLHQTVPALLALRCAATPGKTAYRMESGAGRWSDISWQEFNRLTQGVRRALHAGGLRHGDRLALIAPVSLRWECLHHAALGLGVVVVGLDAHDLPERIAGMLEQADVRALAIADGCVATAVGPARLAACKLLLRLDQAADGRPPRAPWIAWDAFEHLSQAAGEPPLPAVQGTDAATIVFTSGTTGAPKGITYTHGQVCLATQAICDGFSFAGPDARLLCWLPLSNLFQRMVNLAAMRQGPVTYLLDDPRRVMEVVQQVAPDIFIGVPRFYEKLHAGLLEQLARRTTATRRIVQLAWVIGRRRQALARAGHAPPWWLGLLHRLADRLVLQRVRAVMGGRLRCMVSGSAPMTRQLLEDLHGLGWLVLESYGLSENILPMAMNRLDSYRLGTVGRPVPGNEIRISTAGEILVRGPGLFDGYVGDPEPSLDAHDWYHTRDLGTVDQEGFLTLTGRSGDMIKTSTGRRIAPAGVEAVLRSVPGIDQALVLGAGHKCTVALCTCTAAVPATTASGLLATSLRNHLTTVNPHERPAAIAFLPQAFSIEHGELTPNLKLRRDAIARRHAKLVDALYAAADVGHSDRSDVLVLN